VPLRRGGGDHRIVRQFLMMWEACGGAEAASGRWAGVSHIPGKTPPGPCDGDESSRDLRESQAGVARKGIRDTAGEKQLTVDRAQSVPVMPPGEPLLDAAPR